MRSRTRTPFFYQREIKRKNELQVFATVRNVQARSTEVGLKEKSKKDETKKITNEKLPQMQCSHTVVFSDTVYEERLRRKYLHHLYNKIPQRSVSK